MMPRDSDTWFKSSRSTETQDCVEVRLGHQIGIRDTKDRAGGQLAVPATAWSALADELKNA